MAGTTLGFLKFVLGFDTISFKKGMSEAERDLVKLQKKVQAFGAGMQDIGAKMSLALTAPLVAFAGVGVKEARETEVAIGKVNNALTQTGAVAGQTAPELAKAADALELASLYEADEILGQVSATMLRFGKIVPENFQAAQQAAVDLAAATGVDLTAASTMVGKALVAPAKAAKALAAIGITLTKGQIKQLETWNATGQAARTQAVVLDLLNSKIKGAAAAAQATDPYNQMTDAFKRVAESVGVLLLPVLQSIAGVATNVAAAFSSLSPPAQAVVAALLAVVAAAGPALFMLGKIVEISSKNQELIKFAKGLFTVAEGSRAAAAGAALMNIGLGPLLIGLAALAVAVTAVVVAWDNWDKITAFVSEVYDAVKTWIVDGLNAMWEVVKRGLAALVRGFETLLRAVPFIAGIYKAAKAWLVDKLGGAFQAVKRGLDMVVGWFMSAFNWLKKILAPFADIIGGAFSRAFTAVGESFGGVETKVADVKSNLQGSLSGVDLGLDEAVEKSGKKATKKGKDTVAEAAKEFKNLMAGIFPERAAIAEYEAKLKALDAAHNANKLSTDAHAEAVRRLTDNFNDLPDEPPDWWTTASPDAFTATGVFAPLDIGASAVMDKIGEENEAALTKMGDLTRDKTVEMANAFGTMGSAAVGHMKDMVTAFKGGDILGGIQQLLETVLQVVKLLGQVGVFGGTGGASASGFSSGARSGFGGFRATGGPVVPGKTYMVGENGPEWFSSKKRGYIEPGKEAAPTRVVVVPSPYFDTVVDHRAAAVAAPMAGQAAIIGVTGSEMRATRRSRRNLLAA